MYSTASSGNDGLVGQNSSGLQALTLTSKTLEVVPDCHVSEHLFI